MPQKLKNAPKKIAEEIKKLLQNPENIVYRSGMKTEAEDRGKVYRRSHPGSTEVDGIAVQNLE